MTDTLHLLPARQGRAIHVAAGQSLKIVNTHGSQVVDAWIFNAADLGEFLSLEHFRPTVGRTIPRVGDGMISNKRRALATLVEDSSPGIHDTLIAACDPYRYRLLGHQGHHDNCTENLRSALGALGLTPPETPAPLNLWMNIPVAADSSVGFEPPVSKPGDHVLFRAELDCVFVLSACPQDLVPINGRDMVPKDAHYGIVG